MGGKTVYPNYCKVNLLYLLVLDYIDLEIFYLQTDTRTDQWLKLWI
jgi:hypothetical protein